MTKWRSSLQLFNMQGNFVLLWFSEKQGMNLQKSLLLKKFISKLKKQKTPGFLEKDAAHATTQTEQVNREKTGCLKIFQ